jgi:integrase
MATGCRRGEILALTWSDLDVKNRCIKITKQLETTASGGIRVKPSPKSDAGVRTVVIGRRALARLNRFKRLQQGMVADMAELWMDNNLICPDDSGDYRNPDTVSSSFRDWAKAAGVRSLGLHAIRHTEISFLAERGCDIHTNKKRSGHSTIVVTGDYYIHMPTRTDRRAADMLDDLF